MEASQPGVSLCCCVSLSESAQAMLPVSEALDLQSAPQRMLLVLDCHDCSMLPSLAKAQS